MVIIKLINKVKFKKHMIEVFLAIIAIIWLIFASISDIKTHEVPNWLTYSLIIIGFSSALLKSILFKNV